ncbi:MAG: ABC transporter ATP-binding protein/permease [Flavobacteriaceae bacterium]|nr:ABC transporter ATP-binding protein/permease [Flavobacteriaceae bacterium]
MKELQYLNKYLYTYRGKLLLGILITIIARIFSLFTPRLVGNSMTAIEQYISSGQSNTDEIQAVLLTNIALIVAASFISGFFTFLMRQTIINVSRYIEFDLKNEIYQHYQLLCSTFYKKNRTGDLMSRISEDVSKVRMYFGPAIMYSINTIALFIIVISYMVNIAPSLTFYTLLPLPILSLTIYKLSRAINIRSTKVQETLAKLSSFSQEAFSGIAIIKSYNIAPRIEQNFADLSEESKNQNVALAKIQAWFFPLMILLIGFSNLLVIYVGGKQYIAGIIEIGVLAEFIIYVNMLTWPVATVGWVTSIVQQAEASQKRINAFLGQEPSIMDGASSANIKEAKIVFDNVSFTYPDTGIKALKEISFTINPGETLGIIGKTGAGKTTLLELIARLYDPSSGKIFIDREDIRNYPLKELRDAMGYVPQNPFLFSESIEENIRFGNADASMKVIEQAATEAAVAENIAQFTHGYQTLLGERGVTLSGGQIQRISIARALIKDPKVLLFDDCLSAVDADTEEQILSSLNRVSEHKTSCIVSHRISSVKQADKIIVLEEGRIIQQGTHDELVKLDGHYLKLVQKQQEQTVE